MEAVGWNQLDVDLGALVCVPSRRGVHLATCATFVGARPGADPARASAGVSRGQSRFGGSDRQGRGRLVDALRRGPVDRDALALAAGWPDDDLRARRVAETLVTDGLASWRGEQLVLP